MKHLSEEQFIEWASGERSDECAQHVRECAQCLAEVRELGSAFAGFQQEIQAAAHDRHGVFTGSQIRALASTAAGSSRSFWKVFPFPALAALALVAVMVSQPEVVKAPVTNTDAADDALLLAVNADVYRTAPSALRPAAELNKERNQILTSSQNPK